MECLDYTMNRVLSLSLRRCDYYWNDSLFQKFYSYISLNQSLIWLKEINLKVQALPLANVTMRKANSKL